MTRSTLSSSNGSCSPAHQPRSASNGVVAPISLLPDPRLIATISSDGGRSQAGRRRSIATSKFWSGRCGSGCSAMISRSDLPDQEDCVIDDVERVFDNRERKRSLRMLRARDGREHILTQIVGGAQAINALL